MHPVLVYANLWLVLRNLNISHVNFAKVADCISIGRRVIDERRLGRQNRKSGDNRYKLGEVFVAIVATCKSMWRGVHANVVLCKDPRPRDETLGTYSAFSRHELGLGSVGAGY